MTLEENGMSSLLSLPDLVSTKSGRACLPPATVFFAIVLRL